MITECRNEIKWWIRNINSDRFCKSLEQNRLNEKLYTDSSGTGWGSFLASTKEEANGKFFPDQLHHSINNKELMAISLALRAFRGKLREKTVQILMDNCTALSCLVQKGSQNEFIDKITKNIFALAREFKIEIVASFVPGIVNPVDRSSRSYNELTEWSLHDDTMKVIASYGYDFNVNLFASYLNKKHKIFASYKADPEATYVNAYLLNWSNFEPFIFSPPNQMQKILKKLMEDRVRKAVCVAPLFTSALWYPQFI